MSHILIGFMLAMVPVVFLINGFTKGEWLGAALFAVSIAVGLTPEMLPMIVTACLAKGSVALSKRKVVVKDINSIQNLGAMDILCTDKTGTLTQDKVVLEMHLNVEGKEDARVLCRAFLNSNYQTGLKNLMDVAVIERTHELRANGGIAEEDLTKYQKTDEIPFDFERRGMSVAVTNREGEDPPHHQGRGGGDARRVRLRGDGRRGATSHGRIEAGRACARVCTERAGDARARNRTEAARGGRRGERGG